MEGAVINTDCTGCKETVTDVRIAVIGATGLRIQIGVIIGFYGSCTYWHETS